jgi:RNA polymerase subunit RPABC4/transcription elongation factor Spt4
MHRLKIVVGYAPFMAAIIPHRLGRFNYAEKNAHGIIVALSHTRFAHVMSVNLELLLSIVLACFSAYLVAFTVSLVIWTFRDMRSRSRDIFAQLLATLMVAVFNLPGLFLYYILRPKETLADVYERELAEEALLQDIEEKQACPTCHHAVYPEYQICPHCHTKLKKECPNCHRLMHLKWTVCPYCTKVPNDLAPPSNPTLAVPAAERIKV